MNLNIDEQIEYLTTGNVEILPGRESLTEKLKKDKPLRIKLGIDPTSPDLHLGHTVCLQLLKRFQDLGHQPILLIGGFTACLGDPTGRNETRPPLTTEEVQKNAQTYLDQAGKILNMNKTEVVNNHDWLSALNLSDIIKIASNNTVNQMIAKEAFGNRIDAGLPLYLHELFYPILQAYDSVQLKVDIELGGQDQRFNILAGRDMQKAYEQSQQVAMMTPLLVGLDGTKKMSKSYGNYIGISEPANEIYGKTMSLPDELLIDWYQQTLSLAPEELSNIEEQYKTRAINPRNLKMDLAKRLVTLYHSETDALSAEQDFVQRFQKREIPDDMPIFSELTDEMTLAQILNVSGMASSGGEAKRKIKEGAVKINGEKASPTITGSALKDGDIIQLGKRNFIKISK